MIQINGKVRMGENFNEEAIEALVKMALTSREEDGCIDYAFARDLAEPNTLILFERWRDQEALQAHMASEHMAEFQKVMAENPPQSREIRMYVTDDGQPLG